MNIWPLFYFHTIINRFDPKSSRVQGWAFGWQTKRVPGDENLLCAPSKVFHLGKLRQESQLTLQEKEKKKSIFSLQSTTVSIQKTPLPRKLLIFTVSACFFCNCIFMIPCSVLGTFYTQEESLSFCKVEE